MKFGLFTCEGFIALTVATCVVHCVYVCLQHTSSWSWGKTLLIQMNTEEAHVLHMYDLKQVDKEMHPRPETHDSIVQQVVCVTH